MHHLQEGMKFATQISPLLNLINKIHLRPWRLSSLERECLRTTPRSGFESRNHLFMKNEMEKDLVKGILVYMDTVPIGRMNGG